MGASCTTRPGVTSTSASPPQMEKKPSWTYSAKDNLTPAQRKHLIERLDQAKAEGREAIECHHCKAKTAYRYNGFSHRGGYKTLFGCRKCLFTWNVFECNEEDYDFLSQ